ncbi:copper homeostasis protein CutC [Vibrio olivae]|uniref:PF03932 family protein CutC n=1 Tax=Vibrio olivae TaxID=1243002 RepID=A0ABV5HLI1_9VIBR
MTYQLEVCIDNLESLHRALKGGATRIELCSSLALGGLTPSVGMMKQAAKHSNVPVYAMIRPRQGDFVYDQDDLDMMADDIQAASDAGLQGVVLGLLTPEGNIDSHNASALVAKAHALNLGVTFHRAIDHCRNGPQALEAIISLGCERVLTSGLAQDVNEGQMMLSQFVEQAAGRIIVMAGAGLSQQNVETIVKQCGVREVHLSGKSTRDSEMIYRVQHTHMGQDGIDDYKIPVTNPRLINGVASVLNTL